MGFRRDFLETIIFSDQPLNWFVHAEGFHCSALKLIEAGEKLEPVRQSISTREMFHRKYTYKIAVYLLSHSIELMLKSIISMCISNKLEGSSLLKLPAKYSHHVIKMVDDLVTSNILTIEKEDYETLKLVDEYLKWFGRYYCPQKKDISEILQNSYTEPNEQGLIDFKYKLKPDTHTSLKKIYDEITPNIDETLLTMPFLFHTDM